MKRLFFVFAVLFVLGTADNRPVSAAEYSHYRPPQASSYPEAKPAEQEKDKGDKNPSTSENSGE